MFETQLDEICLFPLQNKKKSFTFDDKKADEVKNFGRPVLQLGHQTRVFPGPTIRPEHELDADGLLEGDEEGSRHVDVEVHVRALEKFRVIFAWVHFSAFSSVNLDSSASRNCFLC